MTASKSNRARNARAQGAQAAGGRNGSVPAGRNGTAVAGRNGTAVKDGVVKAGTGAKAGAAVKSASRPQAVAGRGATADRRGPRGAAVEQDVAAAPVSGAVPLWLQLATWALSLAGLGVSIYLTIAHFTESALIGCSDSGLVNCTKVTTSPQSYVFGIPVAVLGLVFYVFAAAMMSPWGWRWMRREVYLLRLASVVVGIGFVIYLLYAELFIIGSICLYCTSVHVLTFLLFGLTVFAAAAWGLPARQRA